MFYLVLSTFCTCSLAAIYGVFFILTDRLRICRFFSIGVTRLAFCFFSNIFSPRQWFVVYFYLGITGGFFPYRKCFYSVSYLIYIYIVIQRQTVSLYHNSSVWLDTQDASSWNRNLANFTLDFVSYCSANERHTSAWESQRIMY